MEKAETVLRQPPAEEPTLEETSCGSVDANWYSFVGQHWYSLVD
jgi:hypothetical protein